MTEEQFNEYKKQPFVNVCNICRVCEGEVGDKFGNWDGSNAFKVFIYGDTFYRIICNNCVKIIVENANNK